MMWRRSPAGQGVCTALVYGRENAIASYVVVPLGVRLWRVDYKEAGAYVVEDLDAWAARLRIPAPSAEDRAWLRGAR